MRSFKLARVAAQAELLRLRRFARRQAVRAALGSVALVFLLALLTVLHFIGYLALRLEFMPLIAAAIVAGVDLLFVLIFGGLALRNTPDRVEREAEQVRRAAQQQMTEAAAAAAIVGPLLRSLGLRKIYAVVLAALTARYLGGRR